MGIGLFVAIRVGLFRSTAEACGLADQGLINLLPEALRPHEGLVVETRHKNGCRQ